MLFFSTGRVFLFFLYFCCCVLSVGLGWQRLFLASQLYQAYALQEETEHFMGADRRLHGRNVMGQ